eukprot:12931152-Prorocentrum_lima.AAC.1
MGHPIPPESSYPHLAARGPDPGTAHCLPARRPTAHHPTRPPVECLHCQRPPVQSADTPHGPHCPPPDCVCHAEALPNRPMVPMVAAQW